MTTATAVMTPEQARQFRAARDYDARTLGRTSKAALAALYHTTLRRHGIESIYGGPVGKDELVAAILDLRYPLDQLNEAIHVLWHQPDKPGEIWDGCEHCTGRAS